jgi:hypothetical protein
VVNGKKKSVTTLQTNSPSPFCLCFVQQSAAIKKKTIGKSQPKFLHKLADNFPKQ